MSRPNILLLHADQQRFDTIAALGATHMRTPNLDRLVRDGVSFTRAYSSTPVCMAARHDLLTGTTARHHGYVSNSNKCIADYGLATVPRLLSESGYQTFAVGKMHFKPEREHHGFAHMYLMEELPSCRENDAYLQYLERVGYGHIRCQHGVRPLFYHTPQVSRVPEEHHGSAWIATQAIELIEQEREQPWFLWASWVGPHPPYYVPERYLEMYRDAELPPPCPLPKGSRQVPPSPDNAPPGSRQLQRLREAYCAATTLIDTHIGRILEALERSGQLANTLIFFTSDHGEMLGDRGGYQKHTGYEGSAHIPMLAMGPGLTAGERVATPVTTWDVSATIVEAAGVVWPDAHLVAGESLRSPKTRRQDRIVFFNHSAGGQRYIAATGHGHKFIHWYNGGDEELYDLVADPTEQRNLLLDGTGPEVGARLRQACLRFEKEQGLAWMVDADGFRDRDFEPPFAHYASLHPPWSSHQFPRWMMGHSAEDLELIAAEMRDCLRAESAAICSIPAWRAEALAAWEDIGGDPAVYEALFAEADARQAID